MTLDLKEKLLHYVRIGLPPNSSVQRKEVLEDIIDLFSHGLEQVLRTCPFDPYQWLSEYFRQKAALVTRAADLPPDLMYQHEYEAKKILLQRMAREYGNVRQRTKELIVARMEMESELNLEPHESALTAGEKTLVHDKTPFNYMDWCPEGQEILSQDHPYFRAYQEANQVYLQSRSRIIENACYGNVAQMIDDILIPCAIDAVVELLKTHDDDMPPQPLMWLSHYLNSKSSTGSSKVSTKDHKPESTNQRSRLPPSSWPSIVLKLHKTCETQDACLELAQAELNQSLARRKKLEHDIVCRDFALDRISRTTLFDLYRHNTGTNEYSGPITWVNGRKCGYHPTTRETIVMMASVLWDMNEMMGQEDGDDHEEEDEGGVSEPTHDENEDLSKILSGQRLLELANLKYMRREELVCRHVWQMRLHHACARVISRAVRRFACRRKIRRRVLERTQAAVKIQRHYLERLFIMATNVPEWCVVGAQVLIPTSLGRKAATKLHFYPGKDFPAGTFQYYRPVDDISSNDDTGKSNPMMMDNNNQNQNHGRRAETQKPPLSVIAWEDIKRHCRLHEDCAGFATDGSLKRFIPTHLSLLSTISREAPLRVAKSKTQGPMTPGLYVKVFPREDEIVHSGIIMDIPTNTNRFGLASVAYDGLGLTENILISKLGPRFNTTYSLEDQCWIYSDEAKADSESTITKPKIFTEAHDRYGTVQSRVVAYQDAKKKSEEKHYLACVIRVQCAWRVKKSRENFARLIHLRQRERERELHVRQVVIEAETGLTRGRPKSKKKFKFFGK